jgi:translation initiation factor IF-2
LSKFNLEEVVKKADMKLDEAIEKLKDAGVSVDINNKFIGENEVKILGLDPKRLQIDKRQDLLKQALERHKRNPKPREVLIKEKRDSSQQQRLTKEELLKKKKELKMSLEKVEEERKKQERIDLEKAILNEEVEVPLEKKETTGEEIQKSDKIEEKPAIETSATEKNEAIIKDTIEVPLVEESIEDKKKREEKLFEKKKAKAKKPLKKDKYLQKNILEGLDELNIEKEKIETELEKSNKKQFEEKDTKGQKVRYKKPEKIEIGETIRVGDLSELTGIKANDLIKKLMQLGVTATINEYIDNETAALLCADYDIEVETKLLSEDKLIPQYEDREEDLTPRPPIVTVMGHVDHGKTSLLDAIRKTKVTATEAGGITQHIGAYEVETKNGMITFLDTPGHEAFTSLRSRGANVTDIAILIVAADDGVMPQTKEAIDHIKAAGVKMVVAINKIDKPNANVERVKSQLAEYGIIPEEWGGEYQFQEISAVKGIGIDDLLDKVLLEAELLDLKANANRPAEGVVIESRLDKHRGPIASVIVKNGTLKKGDNFVIGKVMGRIRGMFNSMGKPVDEASPSIPVEIMGLEDVPEAGEKLIVVESDEVAKRIVQLRKDAADKQGMGKQNKVSIENILEKIKEGKMESLNIIIKADAQGSIEALKNTLLKLSNDEVKVNIIHDSVGGIRESDILLASASNAYIIGFNVRPDNMAKQAAEREGVSIHTYSIIYDVIADVKNLVSGLTAPEMRENVLGRASVRQTFVVSKVGTIAGCHVLEGKVVRGSNARVIRNDIVVYEGKIESLKRFKDDVKEVLAGYECGIGIGKFNDIKENDIIESFVMVEAEKQG